MNHPLFDTVLVANRGEIAVRVIRTLRRLGIRSVAVHSTADAGARHVREADAAICIGPAAAAESYLDIDAVIRAARESGAQAVHPGYGFLSENVDFARALEAEGITFIGPSVHSINLMGDKIRSKNHVAAHGVPVTPGIAEPGMDDGQLIAAAESVGFPLLIKPSAGGGGKGMQAVEDPAGLPAALATARRVARNSFGDDTLFLERLVRSPRHIEVQVLADTHGNTIHLGERECSLQRRHQKVIEEAPAPLLEQHVDGVAIRARIGQAAVDAARSVDYVGAGTVEFLISDENPGEFFFMEMNTRLQVEHPVTEEVVRIRGERCDLVEWQIRIAAGEKLTVAQDDVGLCGHAIEARVYAEQPANGFLPSTGRILIAEEPAGEGIRVDSGIDGSSEVSAHYDPMLAKVIAHGADRGQALQRLDAALAHTVVLGVSTNLEYLRALIAHPDVVAGRLDTTLIDRWGPQPTRQATDVELADLARHFREVGTGVGGPDGTRAPNGSASVAQAAAVQGVGAHGPRDGSWPPGQAWMAADGWRIGAHVPVLLHLDIDGADHTVPTAPAASTPPASPAQPAAAPHAAAPLRQPAAIPPGQRYAAAPSSAGMQDAPVIATEPGSGGRTAWISSGGWSARVRRLNGRDLVHRQLAAIEREEGSADPQSRSPMPGTVVSVLVSDGDTVAAGQTLLAVEAMKMEHPITAGVAGTVSLSAATGDLVKAGQVLATVHPTEGT